jgi:hypothetical protein
MLQSSSNRHISTSTVQSRLRESGVHGRIVAKKPLLKDTNNKKRLAWAKKHEQYTLDQLKSVLWSDQSKFDDLRGSHLEAWRRTCDGVECFVGDTVSDLFRIQGTLNQHGCNGILQRYSIPSGLRLVGLSFVFQQDNDPTHLQAV